MGKKHKKFKKKMLKEMRKLAARQAAEHVESSSEEVDDAGMELSDNQAVLSHPGSSAFSGLDREYSYVKKDVLKIVISLTSILVLLFVLFYINQKTGILTGLGDWAYRASNIHTQ
jgi:hypothetical protein